ncbi:MAG: DUF294 nucleotidyltransferase-like domain-containing protein, partial [Actinomycetota bacterium]
MPAMQLGVAHEWQHLTDATDESLKRIFADAVVAHNPVGPVALLAVGGYGRRELAPFSDLDIVLVHDSKRIDPVFAQALWYPLWDTGRKVGHAVRTPR